VKKGVKMSTKHRVLGAKVQAAVLAVAAATLLASTLTGASYVDGAEEEKIVACFSEYESEIEACAGSMEELHRLALSEYNKVIVESPEEFEAVKASGEFEGMRVSSGVQATYAIGTLFTHANYTGSSHTYTTTNGATCYGQTYSFSFPSLYSYIHDQVSSFSGQGACQVRLYEHINYGGAYTNWADCRTDLSTGSMNDKASSVKFWLSGIYNCY
jgi:hypothetical protein